MSGFIARRVLESRTKNRQIFLGVCSGIVVGCGVGGFFGISHTGLFHLCVEDDDNDKFGVFLILGLTYGVLRGMYLGYRNHNNGMWNSVKGFLKKLYSGSVRVGLVSFVLLGAIREFERRWYHSD